MRKTQRRRWLAPSRIMTMVFLRAKMKAGGLELLYTAFAYPAHHWNKGPIDYDQLWSNGCGDQLWAAAAAAAGGPRPVQRPHWRGRGALGRCKLVNFSFLAPAATDGPRRLAALLLRCFCCCGIRPDFSDTFYQKLGMTPPQMTNFSVSVSDCLRAFGQ